MPQDRDPADAECRERYQAAVSHLPGAETAADAVQADGGVGFGRLRQPQQREGDCGQAEQGQQVGDRQLDHGGRDRAGARALDGEGSPPGDGGNRQPPECRVALPVPADEQGHDDESQHQADDRPGGRARAHRGQADANDCTGRACTRPPVGCVPLDLTECRAGEPDSTDGRLAVQGGHACRLVVERRQHTTRSGAISLWPAEMAGHGTWFSGLAYSVKRMHSTGARSRFDRGRAYTRRQLRACLLITR